MQRPTQHELLKGRLATVRADLDEVMSRLTDDLLEWAPTSRMRTVHGQLAEIAGTEIQILHWIKNQEALSFEQATVGFADVASIDAWRQTLHDQRQETLRYLDSLTEDDLNELVEFPSDWFEALQLPAVPLSEGISSIAQHEWYHAGQLVSYVWSRGDDPYTW